MFRIRGVPVLVCAGLVCAGLFGAGSLRGQTVCAATPVYGICDITFDVPGGGVKTTELNAEFRGPSHRTFLLRAFSSGPNRMTVRFSPGEAGNWDVRLSSSLAAFHDKELHFAATPSPANGWIELANVHHFRYTGGTRAAHLWLGDSAPAGTDAQGFATWADARIAAGVNHVRLRLPETADEGAFAEMDARLALLNGKGVIGDLVLVPPRGADRQGREEFFRNVIARYAARNVTWVILDEFEKYPQAHELVREIAGYLGEDSFHHLRSVGARDTSGPFADEKWMNFRWYGASDWGISATEDQIFSIPGVREVRGSSDDAFRKELWNTTMSGGYPEAASASDAQAKYLGVWQKVLADTRFWDEEPFFDAEGVRGVSLPDTEYLLYVDRPGPVTVHLEKKHKWNGEWINPVTGDHTEIDDFKEDVFNGAPPDAAHDWVLHLYREGHKESLKSYRFEARPVVLQEVEVDPGKVPFDIAKPEAGTLTVSKDAPRQIHLKKETRASRSMIYVWTGEVTADGEGYRVLGTGSDGTLHVPENIVRHFPATFHVRVYGLNAYGKLYSVDQNYAVEP